MVRPTLRRPSPATAIASVALFVSLGGVSYGVATNSIDSRELKNNSVGTKDLRNNDVRSGDIRTGAVTASDLKAGAVTGAKLLESSLGKVPSAGTADTASRANTANFAANAGTVDGVNAARMYFQGPEGTAPTVVLNLGGLVIKVECAAGRDTNAVATTTVNDATISSASIDAVGVGGVDNPSPDREFNVGDTVQLLPNDDNDQVGSFRYFTPSGSIVTGSWTSDDGFPLNTCTFAGHALQSGG